MEYLANKEEHEEIRIAAAREIVRQLSIPSKFAMKVVKEKYGSIEKETRDKIEKKVRFVFESSNFSWFVSLIFFSIFQTFELLQSVDFRDVDMIEHIQMACSAIIDVSSSECGHVIDQLSPSSSGSDLECRPWALLGVMGKKNFLAFFCDQKRLQFDTIKCFSGNIIESQQFSVNAHRLQNLLVLFEKCISKPSLDRADIATRRFRSAICSFSKVIANIQIDSTTNEMAGYLGVFEKIVDKLLEKILSCFDIFSDGETVCVASIALLTALLHKQKECTPYELAQVCQFWKKLIVGNKLTVLSIMSAKSMGMNNGQEAAEDFFKALDTFEKHI